MRVRSKTHIDFTDIDKWTWKYCLANLFQTFAFRRFFYREYRVVGRKNMPKRGVPTLIVSNHQNGLNDALAILCMFYDFRQPTFIARADMFKKPLVIATLKFLKIMPAFRPRDGEDPTKNEEIFNISADVLTHKHTLVLFPEGVADDGHFISQFRKGFARSGFRAEERNDFKLGVKIVPVCNHYSSYTNFREKLALIIGEPVELSDYLERYKENPEKAQLELSRDMHDRVQDLMLDIRPREDYEKLNLLRNIYTPYGLNKMMLRASYFPNHLTVDKKTIAALERLKDSNPEHHQSLLDKAQKMLEGLQQLNLRIWLFNKKLSTIYMMLTGLLFVLLLPLFAVCWLVNFIPYNICVNFLKRVKEKVLISSFSYVLGALILYPIYSTILAVVAWIVSDTFWAVPVTYVLMLLSILFFWNYKKGFVKLRGCRRFYALRKNKNASFLELQSIYKQIVDDIDDIFL